MKHLTAILAIVASALWGCAAERPEVAVLGDSYSTFEGAVVPLGNAVWYFEGGHEHSDVKSAEQTWWHILTADPDGPGEMGVNNSFSGSTVCNTGYDGADYSDRSFITRMNNLGKPDIIFVFGGTNDSWAGAPLGDYVFDGQTRQQLYSFRPAMAYMLAGLREMYPRAEVWFILNTDLKPEINESVEHICEHYGVPVIRLAEIAKDWGHPTAEGMRSIAAQIKTAMTQKAACANAGH